MNPEDEYLLLRKRLDALGYRHPLAVESLPLVDILLSDLLTTTQSLKSSKLKNLNRGAHAADRPSKEALAQALTPFKSDNARLLRENNELSQKLMRQKDDAGGKYREYKQRLRKIENENVDLKRLNDTYIKAAQELEKESKHKSRAIQRLQEKSLQTVVEMPSKKSDNGNTRPTNSIRRQRIQLDSELKPGKIRPVAMPTQQEIDLMRLADNRIAQLTDELQRVKEGIHHYQLERGAFDEKLLLRESEISRLRKELTGGRPEDIVTIEAKCNASDRLIEQLNSQLELTQAANADLENVIEEDRSKFRQLNTQSDQHLQELRAAQAEVQRLTLHLTNVGQQKMVAKDHTSQLKEQNMALEQRLADLGAQNARLQEMLQQMRSDNGVLTGQLRTTQDDQLHQIMANHFMLDNRELTPQKLNMLIRGIEQERDGFKAQAEKLHNELRNKLVAPRNEPSPVAVGRGRAVNAVEVPAHVSSDPLRRSDEFIAVVRQRDSLQLALERFEAHMTEIQANVRTVTRERDFAHKEAMELRQELDNLRNMLVTDNLKENSEAINNVVMNKLEQERDDAQESCRKLQSERDSLDERMKAHEKRHFEERARLEQHIEDLTAKLTSALGDAGEYEARVDNLLAEREALTTRTRQLEQALDNNDKHIAMLGRQIESSKVSIVQLEQRIDEYRLTSERLRTERDDLLIDKKRLTHDVSDLSAKFTKAEQMSKRAKAGLTALDRDKDSIQNALDEKTEILARTEQQLRRVEHQLRQEQEHNHGVRSTSDRVANEILAKEKELQSVRRQLDNAQNDFTREAKLREDAQRQVSRVSEELASMESQRRHKELENDELSRKHVEKDSTLEELNRLLQSHQQKSNADEDDKKAWKNRCDALDNERASALNELAQTRENCIKLEEALRGVQNQVNMQKETQHAQHVEIEQHLKTQEQYDQQNQALNGALRQGEDKIIELSTQLQRVNEDMVQFREMNARLQHDIDSQFTQHTQYKMANEKSIADLNELRQNVEVARNELEAEKAHARELELIVQKSRHKEFEIQLDAAQLKEELLQERDRANHSEQQVRLYERQISEQVGRLNEMETEIETTKRMLTNERYERERTAQMLKQTQQHM